MTREEQIRRLVAAGWQDGSAKEGFLRSPNYGVDGISVLTRDGVWYARKAGVESAQGASAPDVALQILTIDLRRRHRAALHAAQGVETLAEQAAEQMQRRWK